MEYIGFGAIGVGVLIFLIGWIWMIVLGFKEGGALWGILIILFSWIAGLVFCFVKKTGWVPLILMIIGAFFYGVGLVPVMMKVMENMDGMPM